MSEERTVSIATDTVTLDGELAIPDGAAGLVVFAHGSGSSRKSPRNRAVAARLRESRLATLLFDLLTPREERYDAVTAKLRFDIALLAARLEAATDWLRGRMETAQLPLGYFGASTGAAAALVAAARQREPDVIRAIVSRGGRPDLAGDALLQVRAPTLLLVGGADLEVLELNRRALHRLLAPAQLVVVPGATHLFTEPGALDEVSRLAADWFVRHFAAAGREEARWPI